MALKIRLRQQGRRNRLFYRLVLAEVTSPRDGKYVEKLGWYDQHANNEDQRFFLNIERIKHWVLLGAQLTENAEALVKQEAPEFLRELFDKQRKQRCLKAKKRRKA